MSEEPKRKNKLVMKRVYCIELNYACAVYIQ